MPQPTQHAIAYCEALARHFTTVQPDPDLARWYQDGAATLRGHFQKQGATDRKANARLIAAAPELLDAANAALHWWHSDARRMWVKEPAWLEQIRAAIKKAE